MPSGSRKMIRPTPDHQIRNLVLETEARPARGEGHQTPGLATTAPNCAYLATKPRDGRDRCPTEMATWLLTRVKGDAKAWEDRRDGRWLATDLAAQSMDTAYMHRRPSPCQCLTGRAGHAHWEDGGTFGGSLNLSRLPTHGGTTVTGKR